MKIITPLANGEKWTPETSQAIRDIEHELGIKAYQTTSPYIYANRNHGASMSISKKIWQTVDDDILFIDRDVVPTINVIKKLISYNLPVVAAPYKIRGTDGYAFGSFGKCVGDCINANELYGSLIKASWCGAGCMLIRKEVFNNLPYPWFFDYTMEQGDEAITAGEDIGFCILAQGLWEGRSCRKVYDIFVDTGLPVEHLI